nr:ferredoxin reductase [Conexibacter sp. SYSU D00693]
MATLERRAPVLWRIATVTGVVPETAAARTLELDVDDWPGHRAGQHVDVRLTAEDGYQAQRSYSIASAPEDGVLRITVERLEDGEVSPYLVDEVLEGDQLEVRGPIGGHFTWRAEQGGPLLLVAGGSGLVPLMAMLRHHAAQGSEAEVHLVLSARGAGDVLYATELDDLVSRSPSVRLHQTFTRSAPAGWTGATGRVDAALLRAAGPPASAAPRVFVCGPTGFVEHVADLLVELGHAPSAIHAERFGPTGS